MKDHILVRSPTYVPSVKRALLQKASWLDMAECTLVISLNWEVYLWVQAIWFIMDVYTRSKCQMLFLGATKGHCYKILPWQCMEYLSTIWYSKAYRFYSAQSVSEKLYIQYTRSMFRDCEMGSGIAAYDRKAVPPNYTTPILSALQWEELLWVGKAVINRCGYA